MLTKLFTGFALLGSLYASAQVKEKWNARYTYRDTAVVWEDTDGGSSVAIDEASNVYVTGSSMRGGQDIVTIKYNAAGVEQWKAVYSTAGADAGVALALDGQGNIYVTGVSNAQCITLKYNSSGVKQWEALYPGSATQFIAFDPMGNIIVAGYGDKAGQSFNLIILKYNPAGTQLWAAGYNGPGNLDDYTNAMALDKDGNIFIAAESREAGSQTFDFVTLKYNSSGVQQWAKVVDGALSQDDKAKGITVDKGGNVIVTGCTQVDATAPWMLDYLTIKYDNDGSETWRKTYNGPGNSSDGAIAVRTDEMECIYVAGSSHSGAGDMDLAVTKYDKDGNLVWTSRYNRAGGNTEELKAMTIDASANVYITGSSQGPTGRDYATVKYDSSGVEKWMFRYNGPGNAYDDPWSIAVNSKGVTVVTGASPGVKSGIDYATVMYADSTLAIGLTDYGIFSKGAYLKNYPNPFNQTTVIDYNVNAQGQVSLKIFNALGEQVADLVNTHQAAGEYSVEFDGSSLAPGMYFCELRSENTVNTTKLVLQK